MLNEIRVARVAARSESRLRRAAKQHSFRLLFVVGSRYNSAMNRIMWTFLIAAMLMTGSDTRAIAQRITPKVFGYQVVNEYPHDDDAFTQGLVFVNGKLYEGTGQRGESQLRRIDLKTGRIERSISLHRKYFGEGIAVVDDEIYQLTWTSKTAFVFDRDTLAYKRRLRFTSEGWGLTYDGESLILSDGTASIRFLDPRTFRVKRRITVTNRGRAQSELNELEYINGEIWANIWHTDYIARIDPKSGVITGLVNLRGLNPTRGPFNKEKVLNGIAYDAENKRLYVTGKNWPKLFEIRVTQ